uniref:Damage-control phosphatase ARMT1-like metal-binding domain-containing protein n=1 Tax=Felis catus TaxID=9685 RepID=A0ABI7YB25_FELCA
TRPASVLATASLQSSNSSRGGQGTAAIGLRAPKSRDSSPSGPPGARVPPTAPRAPGVLRGRGPALPQTPAACRDGPPSHPSPWHGGSSGGPVATRETARRQRVPVLTAPCSQVVKRAVASQPGSVDAAERAEKFRQKYWRKLQTLRHQPFAYGTLTVRSLLDTREHCLNEFNFPDPYSKVKQKENGVALKCFPRVIRCLDALGWEERQLALVKGLLAGNVFDWGAKAVSDVLESDPQFGFEEAKSKLQERPWLVDSYGKWLQRLKITVE